MKIDLASVNSLITISVFTMMLVFISMMVDLAFGWHKARLREESHSSYALSRSISKFLLYEGVLIMSCAIDILLHFVIFQYNSYFYSIPMVTLLLGILLICIEIWSMREKAEDKQRQRADELIRIAIDMLKKNQAKENKETNNTNHST